MLSDFFSGGKASTFSLSPATFLSTHALIKRVVVDGVVGNFLWNEPKKG